MEKDSGWGKKSLLLQIPHLSMRHDLYFACAFLCFCFSVLLFMFCHVPLFWLYSCLRPFPLIGLLPIVITFLLFFCFFLPCCFFVSRLSCICPIKSDPFLLCSTFPGFVVVDYLCWAMITMIEFALIKHTLSICTCFLPCLTPCYSFWQCLTLFEVHLGL